MNQSVEVTILIPCLNEAETLGTCIAKARRGLAVAGAAGEVLIADNGSTDDSRQIAEESGARVVPVSAKGYGNALMGGIAAARGRFVIMGDADDSYDFLEVPRFIARLREGADLAQGCRLPIGGGTVMPGAMPFLHRWWGNPMFSFLARRWFHAPIHDVYCGMRGFRKEFQQALNQRCTGMEFATEMILKASLGRAKIAEVPITLHPDGRKAHAPHLKTFRDGWRTIRLFLLYSPRWLFLIPGILLGMFGICAASLGIFNVRIGPATFDAHTLLFGSLALLLSFQTLVFALITKTFAISEGFLPQDPRLSRFFELMNLEKGLLLGGAAMFVGFCLLASTVWQWKEAGFGSLPYSQTMRWVIPGATFAAIGFQAILSSFVVSFLGMRRL